MVSIPAGEFTMGSQDGDPDERPAHKVHVNAFSMDVYEVTVGQYADFLQATGFNSPLDWKTMNQPAHQKRPVANVDWADAAAYCKWAGKRLPTEAEWEKAARGTDGRLYPWGNDPPTPLHANYGKTGSHNYGALALVGTLEDGKSPYGIYDMAGNVWEWVSDWYDNDYYKNSPQQNPDRTVNGRVQSDPWRRRGTAMRGTCAPRIGTGIRRRSGAYTSPGSGARRLRSRSILVSRSCEG